MLKKKEKISSFLRVARYLKPYGLFVFGALMMALVGAGSSLILPWLIRDIIDRALIERNLQILLIIAVSVIVLYFFRGVASYLQSYWISLAGFRLIAKLRSELYQHLYSLSAAFFQRTSSGDIISRMTNDITNLQNLFSNAFINLFMNVLIFVGSIVVLFFIHWRLALFTIIVIPLVGASIDILGKKIRGVSHLLQHKTAVLTDLVERAVIGMKIIQSYVSGHHEQEKFERENEGNFSLAMKQARVKALFTPLVEFLASFCLVAVIWYGGREVVFGRLTPGGLISFLGYLAVAAGPMSHFSNAFQLLQQSLASVERVFEILDVKPLVRENPDSLDLATVREEIRFRHISFAYGGLPLFRDFNLVVRKGEKVGIVGPSGAGKTTFINLLLRFYDPDAGSVEIDGVDIRELKIASLRNLIGVVLQDSLILGGTVRENILYGKFTASDEELCSASEKAHADEFIRNLDQGYDTPVGESGNRLSGGQKQRIAIARALLKNPPILVFDEATSSLDPESEQFIIDSIHRIERDKILIVIAHSLHVVETLDRIIFLKDGEINGVGTHRALLRDNPVYREIFGKRRRGVRG
ncbi:MAG TPA: ABC transporter ATP-binding protein [Atribacteraceae bacterium]|nr:ABC transporter ATP-binding protein [Atribacteraceae bacterium]